MKKTILLVLSLTFAFFANAQSDDQPKSDLSPEFYDFFENNNFHQDIRIGEDTGLPENELLYAYDLAKQSSAQKSGIVSTDGINKYFILIAEPNLEKSIPIPQASIDRSKHFHILQQRSNR